MSLSPLYGYQLSGGAYRLRRDIIWTQYVPQKHLQPLAHRQSQSFKKMSCERVEINITVLPNMYIIIEWTGTDADANLCVTRGRLLDIFPTKGWYLRNELQGDTYQNTVNLKTFLPSIQRTLISLYLELYCPVAIFDPTCSNLEKGNTIYTYTSDNKHHLSLHLRQQTLYILTPPTTDTIYSYTNKHHLSLQLQQ
jgi:hypothetical protein